MRDSPSCVASEQIYMFQCDNNNKMPYSGRDISFFLF